MSELRRHYAENLKQFSDRVKRLGVDHFRACAGLADFLREEWNGEGSKRSEMREHGAAHEHIEVHVRADELVVRCRSSVAHGWHVLAGLKRTGFAGRKVTLERAFDERKAARSLGKTLSLFALVLAGCGNVETVIATTRDDGVVDAAAADARSAPDAAPVDPCTRADCDNGGQVVVDGGVLLCPCPKGQKEQPK